MAIILYGRQAYWTRAPPYLTEVTLLAVTLFDPSEVTFCSAGVRTYHLCGGGAGGDTVHNNVCSPQSVRAAMAPIVPMFFLPSFSVRHPGLFWTASRWGPGGESAQGFFPSGQGGLGPRGEVKSSVSWRDHCQGIPRAKWTTRVFLKECSVLSLQELQGSPASGLSPSDLWGEQNAVDWGKKIIMWELWVKFYWGRNKDYSLEDSISDSSEKLLQRGRRWVGKVNIYVILMKGKYVQSSMYYFFAEDFCLSWGADVTRRDFSAFLDMRRCKNWAHKVISWEYLTSWRLTVHFSQSASFLLSTLNSLQRVLKVSPAEAPDLILVEVKGKADL